MQRIIPKSDTIAYRILQLVEKSKLTLEELEAETDIDTHSWSAYTSGKRVPTIQRIIVMCEYFNVSADWLLMRKE